MELYSWQRPLAKTLYDLLCTYGIAVNALPPGTGKTFLTLDVIKNRGRPSLIIAPKQAGTQWLRAAEAYGVRSEILDIINPERISLGITKYYNGSKWALPPNCDVHWDEVHKGPSGMYSLACLALAQLKAPDRGIQLISATLADSPLKLRASGYLLGLHSFVENEYKRWLLKNGCYVRAMPNGERKLAFTASNAKAKEALAQIRAIIGPRMVSMKIDEVPGFPECLVQAKLYDLETEMADAVSKAYEEMEERLRGNGATALVELQHARERAELCKCDLLVALAKDDLEQGFSPVFFFNFRSSLFRFEKRFTEETGLPISMVYGGQSKKDRDNAQDLFQSNTHHACACTADAGGVSINLHDVLHQRPRRAYINPGWSASTTLQVLGRIRRAGGTPVVQTFVLAAGTEEERVYAKLQSKLGNVEALNDADFLPDGLTTNEVKDE